jgi:hypothetical protein
MSLIGKLNWASRIAIKARPLASFLMTIIPHEIRIDKTRHNQEKILHPDD